MYYFFLHVVYNYTALVYGTVMVAYVLCCIVYNAGIAYAAGEQTVAQGVITNLALHRCAGIKH